MLLWPTHSWVTWDAMDLGASIVPGSTEMPLASRMSSVLKIWKTSGRGNTAWGSSFPPCSGCPSTFPLLQPVISLCYIKCPSPPKPFWAQHLLLKRRYQDTFSANMGFTQQEFTCQNLRQLEYGYTSLVTGIWVGIGMAPTLDSLGPISLRKEMSVV